MKTCRDWGIVSPFLISTKMEVSSQSHVPAVPPPPEISQRCPLYRSLGGPQGRSGILVRMLFIYDLSLLNTRKMVPSYLSACLFFYNIVQYVQMFSIIPCLCCIQEIFGIFWEEQSLHIRRSVTSGLPSSIKCRDKSQSSIGFSLLFPFPSLPFPNLRS
jgi:hypothetical protein